MDSRATVSIFIFVSPKPNKNQINCVEMQFITIAWACVRRWTSSWTRNVLRDVPSHSANCPKRSKHVMNEKTIHFMGEMGYATATAKSELSNDYHLLDLFFLLLNFIFHMHHSLSLSADEDTRYNRYSFIVIYVLREKRRNIAKLLRGLTMNYPLKWIKWNWPS